MKPGQCYIICATLLLLALGARGAPLNIVLITADDLNWDSVGCNGCEVPDISRVRGEFAGHPDPALAGNGARGENRRGTPGLNHRLRTDLVGSRRTAGAGAHRRALVPARGNRIAGPECAEEVTAMRKLLAEWMERMHDPLSGPDSP